MKKILKPAEKEESLFYSDFTGKPLGQFEPPVVLKIDFGYGSKYDGSALVLHLDDSDIDVILNLISEHASDEFKKIIVDKIDSANHEYYRAMDSKFWDVCDIWYNVKKLYNKILKRNEH